MSRLYLIIFTLSIVLVNSLAIRAEMRIARLENILKELFAFARIGQ